MTLRLAKHHGMGNDFLILLTDDPATVSDDRWPARARAWCDRRTGIGADGLIIGAFGAAAPTEPAVDLGMTLFNADGSVAEISGNGLRCLVHADARRRGVADGSVVVLTGGGVRDVAFERTVDGSSDTIEARASMGPTRPGPEPDRELAAVGAGSARALALDAADQRLIDVGNPHLVLRVDDPAAVAIAEAGPLHEARWDRGINVHVVAPTPGETDAVDMVIWERGAGITQACGSGATAVARAVHEWGLTGPRVTVHMPGGDAVVEVGDPMYLHGTSVFVADVEIAS